MPRILLPFLLFGLTGVCIPGATAVAQTADSAATDTMFLRARRLVTDGNGAAGRALADSLLAAATPGTTRYAEALFWRASLASTAAAAERDYRLLSIEYPLSPRAEDALLRLAQLELARGDRALALKHLERLTLEHPASPARARTSYWRSRVLFEDGNIPRACAALADATAHLPPGDAELRNQIDYQSRRCLGVDTTTVAEVPRTVPAAPPAAGAPVQGPTTTARTAPSSAAPATPSTAAPVTRVPAAPRPITGSPVAAGFTVQAAAFPARAQADQFRDRLRARGLDARTVGAGQVFRVRIGRYPTRTAANAVAQDLRARKIASDAFVTEAEAQ